VCARKNSAVHVLNLVHIAVTEYVRIVKSHADAVVITAVRHAYTKHVTNVVRISAKIVKLLAANVTKQSVIIVRITRVKSAVILCVFPVKRNTTVY
jgi:hypothetical protein